MLLYTGTADRHSPVTVLLLSENQAVALGQIAWALKAGGAYDLRRPN